MTRVSALTPFIPSDKALARSGLPDLATDLLRADARLAGQLAPGTRETLRRNMAVINSYYSNLIEGNRTLPQEIRAAQRGEYAADPAKRSLQLESLAHIHVQDWLAAQPLSLEQVYSCDFLQAIHRQFYGQLPAEARGVKNLNDETLGEVVPGRWRRQGVKVGHHVPPAAEDLDNLMKDFCEVYRWPSFTGHNRIIAAVCAHHRLVWIHPFLDGNGRVARLFTDSALHAAGLEGIGVWCLSRGLARAANDYKGQLAQADFPRQGNYDGRGARSEQTLTNFCEFMLRTALDQVAYMSSLLDRNEMQTRIRQYIQARNDRRAPGGPLKPAAADLLCEAFQHGELSRARAHQLTALPERTARRLIAQLRQEGLLTQTTPRSPLSWSIPEPAEPWYLPTLA